MVIYVVAGLTDMIDGPLARKLNITSQLGAKLDGGADFLLALVVLFRIAPVIEIANWIMIWIFIAIGMKLISLLIGYMRHKELILLHTYLGKFFAFALFLFPVFYLFMSANTVLIALLVLAMVTFVEDIYINATSKEVDLNDKGVLFHKK